MGHSQVFVIASVGGRRRCLAAITGEDDDPWDPTPRLRRCHQAIRIFSEPENRNAILHELGMASWFDFLDDCSDNGSDDDGDGHDDASDDEADGQGDDGSDASSGQSTASSEQSGTTSASDSQRVSCPFPFIATCLAAASSYDLSSGDITPRDCLPIDTPYDEAQNEEGIAVLDISDLDRIHYCFAWSHGRFPPISWKLLGQGWLIILWRAAWVGDDHPDDTDVPLSAWQFLQARSRIVPDEVPEESPLADELGRHPLIEPQSLAEVWPKGRWLSHCPGASASPPEQTLSRGPQSSLREQSARVMVRSILASSDLEPSLLEDLRGMPNSQTMLEKLMLENKEGVSGSAPSIELLELAYGGQSYVDWSMYPSLPAEAVGAALKRRAFDQTTAVSLHAYASAVPQKLAELLDGTGPARNLLLFSQPGRRDESADRQVFAACCSSGRGLVKGALYLSTPFASGLEGRLWLPHRASIAASKVFPITQLLVAHQESHAHRRPRFEYFFLGDSLCTPVKAVNGFLRYIRGLCHDNFGHNGGSGLAAAYGFACGSLSLARSDQISIGPLPAETYLIAKRQWQYRANRLYSRMRDLTPEAWTIVLTKDNVPDEADESREHESYHVHLKYALVRSKGTINAVPTASSRKYFASKDLDVADLKQFLMLTAPHVHSQELTQALEALHKDMGRLFEACYGHQDGISLAPLSVDEACDLLNQFSSNVPKVERAAKKAMRGEDGENGDAWLKELGFETSPEVDPSSRREESWSSETD